MSTIVKYSIYQFENMFGNGGREELNSKILALILVIVLLATLISVPIVILLLDKEDTEGNDLMDKEVPETANERSIFFDKDPDEVANIIGMAARNSTFISSEVEFQCAGCIWKDYYFGNDDHLNIEYSQYGDDEYYYKNLYFAKSDYKENQGNWNEQYAIDHMRDVLSGLLDPYNISEISDYEINIIPWGYGDTTWKVSIVQILNGFEVDGTGMVAHISRTNGEIRTMTVKDWIIPDYEFNRTVTITKGKELIYSELEALDFNLSYNAVITIEDPITGKNVSGSGSLNKVFNITLNDIDFNGPALFDGHLCHMYDVELSDNGTSFGNYSFFLDAETGLVLKWIENYGEGGRSSWFLNNLIGEEIKWSDRMKEYKW